MNKLRIAVIGAGRWGKNHVKTLSKMGCLAAVIDGNAQTLADIQLQYPQIQTHGSLDDRDALGYDAYVVAVPAEHHFKVAATCIKAKKHVLVEKPLTLSSADSDQLVQLAKDNGVQVLVGHLLLFHPAFLKMKSLIDQGKIGNLQYIYSNRLNLGTVRKEENSLWSFAPHDIALFQYFIGQDPLRVDCQGGAFLQSHIHDTTVTSIRYPNNVCGHIFVSWLHPFKEHRFVMIGSKGMISYEDSSPEKELVFYEKGIDWVAGEPIKRDGPAERIVYNQAAPLEAELQHFIAVIEGRSQNQLISGEAGAAVLRILEMAEEKLHAKQTEMAITEPKTPIQRDYFVHQTAVVDDPVKIGKGTKIWHFSHVQSNAQIGENTILGQNVNVASHVKIGSRVKIQNNVSVYEGVELEDYVFCGPSMVFTNIRNPRCKYPQARSECYIKTLVKEGASLGANSTIVCGVTIGKFAFVAAGAVVTKDVPDYALVLGNPAKVVGWFSEAGFRLDFDQSGEAFCAKSQRRYQLKEGLVYDITESKPLEKESRYVNH